MPARDPRELFNLHNSLRALRPRRKSRIRLIALSIISLCFVTSLSLAFFSGIAEKRLSVVNANLAAAGSLAAPLLDRIYHFFCPWFGGCLQGEQAGEELAVESMGTNPLATTSAAPQPGPRPPAYAPATSAPSQPAGPLLTEPESSPAQPIKQTIVNQPVIERVVETQRVVTEGGVSENILTSALNQLENKLRSLIYHRFAAWHRGASEQR